jgi:asparagine synthase (glutamine-hydrolysing)
VANHLFDADFLSETREAARTYAEEASGNRRSFIGFKQVPWHHFGRFAVEQSQLNVRSPFLDNDLVALAFQAPVNMETNTEPCLRLIRDGNPRLAQIPTDRGTIDMSNKMANSIRRRMQNFLAKAEYAYDYGMPQWLARIDHVVASLKLERLFLGRQKFCHFRVWYRDQLAPYVKETLLDPRSLSRSYLKRRQVEQMVTDHLRGNRNFTAEIHKLLTVELLHRLLIEQR